MPLITIEVATHKRPKMLAQTLASLALIKIPEGCSVQLIVADNAPEDPAADVFRQYQDQMPFPAVYVQEPKKGLVYVREKLLQQAKEAGADFMACIDDDETAHPDWLVHHYQTHLRYNADVVSGRTLRVLPANTPQWIIKGGFFEKGNRPTGIRRPTSSHSNVFFNFKKLYLDFGLRYDERLNFIGGEDILFFRQAHEKGARIIWCNESIVEEVIPESRVTQQYLLQRAYAIGTTTAYRYKQLYPAYDAYPRMLLFSLGEYITAFSHYFRPDNGMPLINETRRKHHVQIARGIYNGLFKMEGAEVYKQRHGV